MKVSGLIACMAAISGTFFLSASSPAHADAFWAQNYSTWCLNYETSKTCLPDGSEPSKIREGEVVFKFRGNELELPFVISSSSDERAKAVGSALDERQIEVLYSSRENGIETTVLKSLGLYIVEFRLAPNANLRVAGVELDHVEEVASDIIKDWTAAPSPENAIPERCKRFFHADCVDN